MALNDAKSFAAMRAKEAEKREKRAKKLADPAYRAAQLEKQKASQDRRVAAMKARQADPAYRKEQDEKRRAAQERSAERRRQKALEPKAPKPPKVPKPAPARSARKATSSRGMKGRSPTASEQAYMDALGALPCICCKLRGRHSPVISLHHIAGRVKPDAHKLVLPLCQYHHDVPIEKALRELYPFMIPIHAKGSFGGPGAWSAEFGSEYDLLALCYAEASLAAPDFLAIEHPNKFG